MASSSGVGEVPLSPSIGFRREASTMSSLLRVIMEDIQLWSSHEVQHKTPVGAPDSLAQACSAWAKARVCSCLMTQKFLGQRHQFQAWTLGSEACQSRGGSHYLEASCWAAGSLKATACHDTWCQTWKSLSVSSTTVKILLLAFISLHWGDGGSTCRGSSQDLVFLCTLIWIWIWADQWMFFYTLGLDPPV